GGEDKLHAMSRRRPLGGRSKDRALRQFHRPAGVAKNDDSLRVVSRGGVHAIQDKQALSGKEECCQAGLHAVPRDTRHWISKTRLQLRVLLFRMSRSRVSARLESTIQGDVEHRRCSERRDQCDLEVRKETGFRATEIARAN